jgi:lipoprotein LpqS
MKPANSSLPTRATAVNLAQRRLHPLHHTGRGYILERVDAALVTSGPPAARRMGCGRSQWLSPRLRSTVAVVVVAWLLAGVAGAHCGFPRFESHPTRPSHSINIDHANLSDGSRSSCPANFATAVIPRSATSLAALGAVVAVVAIVGTLWVVVAPAVRDPPSGLVYPFTGQAILTRFCVARR